MGDPPGLMRIDPLELPSDEECVAMESSYRRGYTHGYQQAVDDFLRMSRGGYSRSQEVWNVLQGFVDSQVMRVWRRASRDMTQPPRAQLPAPWRTLRLVVLARDGHACVLCGSNVDLECDHILPVRSGGRPTLDNLRTLCQACHRSRE